MGTSLSDIGTHLDQRLPSIAAEAMEAMRTAINQIMSIASGHGALGGSRVWFQYDEPIEREFVNALNKAAGLIQAIAGSAAPQYAGHLEKLASGLIEQILQWREEARGQGLYNDNEYRNAHIARLRRKLARAQSDIIGDFRFGVVEGKQMASDGVQNVVTIQNVRESIISVVQTGHLSSSYQELGRRLAETLTSPEVEQLSPADKEEIVDLAGHVKDELAKQSPDQGRMRRGLARLGKTLGSFGANTASATIGKLIADYFSS
jgi:hypothetical protein